MRAVRDAAPLALLLCLLVSGGACTHSAAAGADAASTDGGKLDAGDARAPLPPYDAGLDEQIPATTSEDLTARGKHMLEAITHDNPDLGADMLFPRDAYIAVKDVSDPGRLWDRKVLPLWTKRIHKLHRHHGMERAQFVAIEIGHTVLQPLPKRNEWKKSLWMVKKSKLVYSIDGKTMRLDLPEMTAWRGAWYVSRL